MAKSYIVLGEAPESESEEEIDMSVKKKELISIKSPEGNVVAGEAPESDEENGDTGSLESISSALSVSSLPSLLGGKRASSSKEDSKYPSLLNKKLREKNVSFHKNVHEFVSQTVTSAGKELNSTNQQLLKCQVQLQEAAAIFRSLNAKVSHLEYVLASITSTHFIPDIAVDKLDHT